ncbi:MAG: N-acetyltransferase [Acidimicrobiia bacterium]|nr:N-acetyltransferase [Acidimicrobiia bacterium]
MIKHEETGNRGAFYFEREGERLASMTYSRTTPTLVIIDHTEVSDVLKGQGMGRQLLDALVAWARETNTRLMATCPYALAQFKKDATLHDVVAR